MTHGEDQGALRFSKMQSARRGFLSRTAVRTPGALLEMRLQVVRSVIRNSAERRSTSFAWRNGRAPRVGAMSAPCARLRQR